MKTFLLKYKSNRVAQGVNPDMDLRLFLLAKHTEVRNERKRINEQNGNGSRE